jgi:predicted dehydrogenase
MKKEINWAVVGSGGISHAFARGLRAAGGARLLAVASRSREGAEGFAARHGVPKTYTEYDAMLNDGDIDVVYLGVPHTAHKALAIAAFNAGKAVLCEKPAALSAGELAEMIGSARENRVFFMEALWTRFVPPVCKVREWLADGLIGDPRIFQGNFGFRAALPPTHRLLDINQGGGALLDAGVYPISFASMAFGGGPARHAAGVLSLGETGVDEEAAAVISFGSHKTAVVSASLSVATVSDAWIYGTEGYIHLPSFVFCHSANLVVSGKSSYHWEGDFRGNGYNYEAEAVMECLREGKKECELMPPDESLSIARIMDELRAAWGFTYPQETR